MQNGAYGTVELPAAPKKKSIKRIVACGQCKNGWCSPNKQSCNYDYDCPRDKAVCGPNGYCVGK